MNGQFKLTKAAIVEAVPDEADEWGPGHSYHKDLPFNAFEIEHQTHSVRIKIMRDDILLGSCYQNLQPGDTLRLSIKGLFPVGVTA